ncbi:YhaN family protein [Sphingorhabdus sp. YGSMI21]|uniref:YhaN family protein n=1 Tax=Sphingorhabdus sp. YGSMI21 TaxID=2077182 RepID=UPI000C1DD33F|nr:YhaN family protein [Sphingorhabdus sp. YGSMI21]ATW05803.1 hypothetical protein CHN51_19280 [Sphingorhabdus sp. YGSMI21]
MQLTELTLERYGAFSERILPIPTNAGLTIIYGPNEAGKSTCLAAISDILFGIPERTPHASLFGYDGMRVSAELVDADGTALTLRRRRGRVRTLSDAAGTPLDDSILNAMLGATTRERFATLFGLNHETLRSGGSSLLAAEGDIGRLIVEAGGGLRSLMARLDSIDEEADKLFAPRKSSERAYYKALEAFDTAEREVKLHMVTRDAYEKSRKAADAATKKLDDTRAERQNVSTEISVLERLVRAVPHILTLDRLSTALSEYEDISALEPNFDKQINAALKLREETVSALTKGRINRDRLSLRFDALEVSEAFIGAEAAVRDITEQAIHVRKARADRPNRLKEIESDEARLTTLRRMLHLPADADLTTRLPSQEVLDEVQKMATQAIERGTALVAARERKADITDRLEVSKHRLDVAIAAGYQTPVEFSPVQFANLSAQVGTIETTRGQAVEAMTKVKDTITSLGFQTSEELASFDCPSSEAIRTEQVACSELEKSLADQLEQRIGAEKRAKTATNAIAQAEATGPVASDSALADARNTRSDAWSPLRSAYLDDDIPADTVVRRTGIEVYERQIRDTDDLADRRAAEAKHAANLAVARQQLEISNIEIEGCTALIEDIGQRLNNRTSAFASAFPSATEQYPQLSGLLEFAERRELALAALAAARALQVDVDRQEADLEPVCALFETAQGVMKVTPTEGQTFSSQVHALCAALSKHESGNADYRRNLHDYEELEPKANRAEQDLSDMLAAEKIWDQQWSAALVKLGLDSSLAPQNAGTLVSEWSGARATLGTIAQSQTRLTRMDEDEAALQAAVDALGESLQLALPTDLLAATDQIAARWQEHDAIRVQRVALAPDVEEIKADCALLETADRSSQKALEALAERAGVPAEDAPLRDIERRCAARSQLMEEKVQAERSIADVSDGLSVTALRDQWAERDLDALRGALSAAQEQSKQFEAELEATILEQKTAQDALDQFAAESGVNHAIAERESAAAAMQIAIERYVELTVARALITKAIEKVRNEQQDPLVSRAGELFAFTTRGEFAGIDTDIDDKGQPVVVGRRKTGSAVSVANMSDGTRDQLFLAFRLASLEHYAASTEPLPFIADDILVHFDDERSAATLDLLAEFAKTNQVLLFTHHSRVRDDANRLEAKGLAKIVEIERV